MKPEFKILIADDDRTIRNLVQAIFAKDKRLEVVEARDGTEAIASIRESEVDLVLADIKMPGISGVELLVEIRRTNPKLPVIIITGNPGIESAIDCMRLGVVDYIAKPFSVEKMERIVRNRLIKGKNYKEYKSKIIQAPVIDKNQEILASYKAIRILGEGNMAFVYLAEKEIDNELRKFAIKVFKIFDYDEKSWNTQWNRFVNEAEAAMSVKHKNIIKIIEYGYSASMNRHVPFIVMEYIDGKSLKDVIRSKMNLSYSQKLWIIRQVADALSAIHTNNICHRDIKPDNILLEEDFTVKLADFGIARLPDSDLTLDGDLMGSPLYLSPEAFESAKAVDFRSDLFSLGSVAFEFFVGEQAFKAKSIQELSRRIRQKEVFNSKKLPPNFPHELRHILEKMLKKNPSERYGLAMELLTDIDHYLATQDWEKKRAQV